MAKYCPNCGAKNEDSYKFCVNCGYDITNVKSVSEQQNVKVLPLRGANYKPFDQSSEPVQTQPVSQQPQMGHESAMEQLYTEDFYNTNPEFARRIELWKAFVQKNTEYYIPKFINFYLTDKTVSWNWATFFFGSLWFAYRKMLLIGLGIALISLIPFVALALYIITAIWGNFIYFKFVEKEVNKALEKEKLAGIDAKEYLQSIGGVSVANVFKLLFIMFIILLIINLIVISLGGSY